MSIVDVFRREFWIADDATGARLGRVDRDIDARDACVTDVPNAPYQTVSVRSLPNVAWPDALPEWEDLTRDELDDHRSWCRDLCAFCEGHRQFGYCPGCTNPDAEAVDGLTVCCGQDVLTGDVVDRAWAS